MVSLQRVSSQDIEEYRAGHTELSTTTWYPALEVYITSRIALGMEECNQEVM